MYFTLRWRHNKRDGVSNQQPHHCLLNSLFRRRSKKTWSSASLDFVTGIHRWPVNSPHKGPVKRKKFPFDDVIKILYFPKFYVKTTRCYFIRQFVKYTAWSHIRISSAVLISIYACGLKVVYTVIGLWRFGTIYHDAVGRDTMRSRYSAVYFLLIGHEIHP